MAIVLPKFPRGSLSPSSTNEETGGVVIRLTGMNRNYCPGDPLTYHYLIRDIDAESIVAIEASVVWFTEGKGSEDIGVHCFQRLTAESITNHDWLLPMTVRTELPECPLSYEGRILKIRWCIRVRIYLEDGTEMIAQEPFLLAKAIVPKDSDSSIRPVTSS